MADSETNGVALTTIYTSNIPGDVGGTNTTNIFSQTSDAHVEECPDFYRQHYCNNDGVCNWLTGINKPSCSCPEGFYGERCGIKTLTTGSQKDRPFGDYWEVFIIGTIFGIVVLLTLIGAIVFVVKKRKETQSRRQTQRQEADQFIQTNFSPSDDVEGADANQNKSPDRYVRLPTREAYHLVEVANTDESLQTTRLGSLVDNHNNSPPFRLQDPPFRKASGHSTHSSSKESTV